MNTLVIYRKSIGRRVVLDRQTEYELILAARAGDQTAATTLFKAHAWQVVGIAAKYQGNGVELEDLIQAGNFGLLLAIKYFKPGKSRLSTYCHFSITHRIMREIEGNSIAIRRPHGWFRPARHARLVAGLTREQSAALANNFSNIDNIGGNIPDRDHEFDAAEHERARRLDDIRASINDLVDEKERFVIRARLKGEAFAAIGKRLNLTKERIRQIEIKAARKLREMLVLEEVA